MSGFGTWAFVCRLDRKVEQIKLFADSVLDEEYNQQSLAFPDVVIFLAQFTKALKQADPKHGQLKGDKLITFRYVREVVLSWLAERTDHYMLDTYQQVHDVSKPPLPLGPAGWRLTRESSNSDGGNCHKYLRLSVPQMWRIWQDAKRANVSIKR